MAIAQRDTTERAATATLPARMPALDGIRGLGMSAVMVAHLAQYAGLSDSPVDNAMMKSLLRGGYAVIMFFVLSGFLITGSLLDTKDRPRYFRNFYARRSLRIFPLYFGVLALVMLVIPAVFPVSETYRVQTQQQGWYWVYLTNIGITIHDWEKFQYFGHFWTLATEEQFYLVWPFVVLALGRVRLKQLCVVCLGLGLVVRIALLTWVNEASADVLLPANLDSLALGALLAIRAREGRGFPLRRLVRVALVAPFAFASLPVWSALLPSLNHVFWALMPTVTMLGFAGVMMAAVFAPAGSTLHRVTTWRPAMFLGTISYGIYVFHQPVIFLVVRGLRLDAQDVPALGSWHLPGLVVVGAVASALTGVLATASWYLVERPVLRLKRRF